MEDFHSTFSLMCGGLLDQLDWSNVLVAGGIVLATMLCPPNGAQQDSIREWLSSDVDIFIYGLTAERANRKLLHIFSIFQHNLHKVMPGCKPFVIRRPRAISFLAKYPLCRIQIILTLARSPKEILSDFDLDVCAMGYDGKQVWMMPSAVRALESEFKSAVLSWRLTPQIAGYKSFTMTLLHGEFLRATQMTRIPR